MDHRFSLSSTSYPFQVRQALGEIPIVDDEIRRAAGTAAETASASEDENAVKMSGGAPKQLVTADGTYASQSAFSAAAPSSRWVDLRLNHVFLEISVAEECVCVVTKEVETHAHFAASASILWFNYY